MADLQQIVRYVFVILMVNSHLKVDSFNQKNSLFELHSSTALLTNDMTSEEVSTHSRLDCAMRCLSAQMCTACSFEQHRRICKISRVPKNNLLFKIDEYVETLVMKPCFENPPLCKNGGTCMENSNGEGYNCMCTEGWQGYHCETEIDWCPWQGFTFYPSTKLCYLVNYEQADYVTAEQKCRERNATLAIGSSPHAIATILYIAKSHNLWLTIGCKKTHGTWRWLDNSTAHIQWRLQGEPSGDGNCANTFADGSGLNDMPCDIARPYLCQAKNVLQV